MTIIYNISQSDSPKLIPIMRLNRGVQCRHGFVQITPQRGAICSSGRVWENTADLILSVKNYGNMNLMDFNGV